MKTIFNAMPLNHYFKGKFHKKGFTLIELLIVVAIIAILTGIGATRYQEVIRRGRDTQRKSDLRSVAVALEQYYSDRSSYPTDDTGSIKCGTTPPPTIPWGNTFVCNWGSGNVTYSGNLPTEKTGSVPYYYQGRNVSNPPTSCGSTESTCQRYVLAAVLENTKDPEIPSSGICFTSPSGTEYNFCVHNP